ncbi:unnamed protein product [Bursaphelenchus xylophilus]|uniref:(pine wood nematode) hypothetical protein n=1 Tax=Bursaphelenchus xylophilus TaxID=6326 RepID=A0A1I7S6I8_BURXY|nr:unnamed protein product [Bursaphelenchus xylophilus]CAG9120480.1 unnamed protein product [Bursaphelenchus xylophilus]
MAENYRPITCLNGCYKIVNAIVADAIYDRITGTLALPQEQTALKRGSWGCVDAQLYDLARQLRLERGCGNVDTAWVDFSKAYDSLNHDAISRILKSLRLSEGMEEYVRKSIKSWRTHIELSTPKGRVRGKEYRISRGVLKGDSLSPTLFVVATSIITYQLNQIPNSTHQFCMDDLKLYASNDEGLETAIKCMQKVGNKLGLSVNLKKCAVLSKTIKTAIAGIDALGKECYKYWVV